MTQSIYSEQSALQSSQFTDLNDESIQISESKLKLCNLQRVDVSSQITSLKSIQIHRLKDELSSTDG